MPRSTVHSALDPGRPDDPPEQARPLVDFFVGQTDTGKPAAVDYEAHLCRPARADAVGVVPADFEALLLQDQAPSVDPREAALTAERLRRRRPAGRHRPAAHEPGTALRGVSIDLPEPVAVDVRDLASTCARTTQITGRAAFPWAGGGSDECGAGQHDGGDADCLAAATDQPALARTPRGGMMPA